MNERFTELTDRYLTGDLNREESAELTSLLRDDPRLLFEMERMSQAFALLAAQEEPLQPPAYCKAAIFGEIRSRVAMAAVSASPGKASRVAWGLIPWSIAACLVAVATWLASQLGYVRGDFALADERLSATTRELEQTREQLNGLSAEVSQVQEQNQQLAAALARANERGDRAEMQISFLHSELDAFAQVVAAVAWDDETQSGMVRVTGLPMPEPGTDYQLWVLTTDDSGPVSAGVLPVEKDEKSCFVKFTPATQVTGVTRFAVSIERSGGTPAPEGPVILVGR